MALTSPYGSLVDYNVVIKRIYRLKKLIEMNSVTKYKALSTTVLGDINTLNTLVQASVTNKDLSASPLLPLHDDPEQTSNT